MRATATAVVLSFFCAGVAIYRDSFDGVSMLALLFMFVAFCVAPLERKRGSH